MKVWDGSVMGWAWPVASSIERFSREIDGRNLSYRRRARVTLTSAEPVRGEENLEGGKFSDRRLG
jgi:hypothetical protein